MAGPGAAGEPFAWAGVYDGHGGFATADWLQKRLFGVVEKEWAAGFKVCAWRGWSVGAEGLCMTECGRMNAISHRAAPTTTHHPPPHHHHPLCFLPPPSRPPSPLPCPPASLLSPLSLFPPLLFPLCPPLQPEYTITEAYLAADKQLLSTGAGFMGMGERGVGGSK